MANPSPTMHLLKPNCRQNILKNLKSSVVKYLFQITNCGHFNESILIEPLRGISTAMLTNY